MSIKPPIAEKKPETFETHGHVREDNYYWLRKKSNPDVISYLEAENEYTEAMMADTKDLQEKLYQEMRGKIKETDTSAPVKIDNYYYYNRTEEGKEYPIYCRKKEKYY